MLAKIYTAATNGLEGVIIDVEVDIANRGLPSLSIVGLPDKAVEEAKDRVRTALYNTGIQFPPKKITINLAPADIQKEGPSYDLPIAVGILIAVGEFDAKVDDCLFIGELSLDGSVRRVNGILPIVITARESGFKRIFVPPQNAQEAAVIKGIEVYAVESLKGLIAHLTQKTPLTAQVSIDFLSLVRNGSDAYDFSDVEGQEQAKRALEIAAAGGHHVFLNGSPGSGKTMLARSFPSILPSISEEEALEVTKLYSIAGLLEPNQALVIARPYRSPHHTVSRVGLIGGGSTPKPGEISLSHRGVLFLDELPEFPRSLIESLRQPIEDGFVQISRASGTMFYPCKFTLIAAANPCPCGYYLSTKKSCVCTPSSISRYQKKVSGPILDRIDLHVAVSEIEIEKLSVEKSTSEKSSSIRGRVETAREIQRRRYEDTTIMCNGELTTKQAKHYIHISETGKALLLTAANKLGLTARSYFKIIKVSQTIADLEGANEVEERHVAESLQFRPIVGN